MCLCYSWAPFLCAAVSGGVRVCHAATVQPLLAQQATRHSSVGSRWSPRLCMRSGLSIALEELGREFHDSSSPLPTDKAGLINVLSSGTVRMEKAREEESQIRWAPASEARAAAHLLRGWPVWEGFVAGVTS